MPLSASAHPDLLALRLTVEQASLFAADAALASAVYTGRLPAPALAPPPLAALSAAASAAPGSIGARAAAAATFATGYVYATITPCPSALATAATTAAARAAADEGYSSSVAFSNGVYAPAPPLAAIPLDSAPFVTPLVPARPHPRWLSTNTVPRIFSAHLPAALRGMRLRFRVHWCPPHVAAMLRVSGYLPPTVGGHSTDAGAESTGSSPLDAHTRDATAVAVTVAGVGAASTTCHATAAAAGAAAGAYYGPHQQQQQRGGLGRGGCLRPAACGCGHCGCPVWAIYRHGSNSSSRISDADPSSASSSAAVGAAGPVSRLQRLLDSATAPGSGSGSGSSFGSGLGASASGGSSWGGYSIVRADARPLTTSASGPSQHGGSLFAHAAEGLATQLATALRGVAAARAVPPLLSPLPLPAVTTTTTGGASGGDVECVADTDGGRGVRVYARVLIDDNLCDRDYYMRTATAAANASSGRSRAAMCKRDSDEVDVLCSKCWQQSTTRLPTAADLAGVVGNGDSTSFEVLCAYCNAASASLLPLLPAAAVDVRALSVTLGEAELTLDAAAVAGVASLQERVRLHYLTKEHNKNSSSYGNAIDDDGKDAEPKVGVRVLASTILTLKEPVAPCPTHSGSAPRCPAQPARPAAAAAETTGSLAVTVTLAPLEHAAALARLEATAIQAERRSDAAEAGAVALPGVCVPMRLTADAARMHRAALSDALNNNNNSSPNSNNSVSITLETLLSKVLPAVRAQAAAAAATAAAVDHRSRNPLNPASAAASASAATATTAAAATGTHAAPAATSTPRVPVAVPGRVLVPWPRLTLSLADLRLPLSWARAPALAALALSFFSVSVSHPGLAPPRQPWLVPAGSVGASARNVGCASGSSDPGVGGSGGGRALALQSGWRPPMATHAVRGDIVVAEYPSQTSQASQNINASSNADDAKTDSSSVEVASAKSKTAVAVAGATATAPVPVPVLWVPLRAATQLTPLAATPSAHGHGEEIMVTMSELRATLAALRRAPLLLTVTMSDSPFAPISTATTVEADGDCADNGDTDGESGDCEHTTRDHLQPRQQVTVSALDGSIALPPAHSRSGAHGPGYGPAHSTADAAAAAPTATPAIGSLQDPCPGVPVDFDAVAYLAARPGTYTGSMGTYTGDGEGAEGYQYGNGVPAQWDARGRRVHNPFVRTTAPFSAAPLRKTAAADKLALHNKSNASAGVGNGGFHGNGNGGNSNAGIMSAAAGHSASGASSSSSSSGASVNPPGMLYGRRTGYDVAPAHLARLADTVRDCAVRRGHGLGHGDGDGQSGEDEWAVDAATAADTLDIHHHDGDGNVANTGREFATVAARGGRLLKNTDFATTQHVYDVITGATYERKLRGEQPLRSVGSSGSNSNVTASGVKTGSKAIADWLWKEKVCASGVFTVANANGSGSGSDNGAAITAASTANSSSSNSSSKASSGASVCSGSNTREIATCAVSASELADALVASVAMRLNLKDPRQLDREYGLTFISDPRRQQRSTSVSSQSSGASNSDGNAAFGVNALRRRETAMAVALLAAPPSPLDAAAAAAAKREPVCVGALARAGVVDYTVAPWAAAGAGGESETSKAAAAINALQQQQGDDGAAVAANEERKPGCPVTTHKPLSEAALVRLDFKIDPYVADGSSGSKSVESVTAAEEHEAWEAYLQSQQPPQKPQQQKSQLNNSMAAPAANAANVSSVCDESELSAFILPHMPASSDCNSNNNGNLNGSMFERELNEVTALTRAVRSLISNTQQQQQQQPQPSQGQFAPQQQHAPREREQSLNATAAVGPGVHITVNGSFTSDHSHHHHHYLRDRDRDREREQMWPSSSSNAAAAHGQPAPPSASANTGAASYGLAGPASRRPPTAPTNAAFPAGPAAAAPSAKLCATALIKAANTNATRARAQSLDTGAETGFGARHSLGAGVSLSVYEDDGDRGPRMSPPEAVGSIITPPQSSPSNSQYNTSNSNFLSGSSGTVGAGVILMAAGAAAGAHDDAHSDTKSYFRPPSPLTAPPSVPQSPCSVAKTVAGTDAVSVVASSVAGGWAAQSALPLPLPLAQPALTPGAGAGAPPHVPLPLPPTASSSSNATVTDAAPVPADATSSPIGPDTSESAVAPAAATAGTPTPVGFVCGRAGSSIVPGGVGSIGSIPRPPSANPLAQAHSVDGSANALVLNPVAAVAGSPAPVAGGASTAFTGGVGFTVIGGSSLWKRPASLMSRVASQTPTMADGADNNRNIGDAVSPVPTAVPVAGVVPTTTATATMADAAGANDSASGVQLQEHMLHAAQPTVSQPTAVGAASLPMPLPPTPLSSSSSSSSPTDAAQSDAARSAAAATVATAAASPTLPSGSDDAASPQLRAHPHAHSQQQQQQQQQPSSSYVPGTVSSPVAASAGASVFGLGSGGVDSVPGSPAAAAVPISVPPLPLTRLVGAAGGYAAYSGGLSAAGGAQQAATAHPSHAHNHAQAQAQAQGQALGQGLGHPGQSQTERHVATSASAATSSSLAASVSSGAVPAAGVDAATTAPNGNGAQDAPLGAAATVNDEDAFYNAGEETFRRLYSSLGPETDINADADGDKVGNGAALSPSAGADRDFDPLEDIAAVLARVRARSVAATHAAAVSAVALTDGDPADPALAALPSPVMRSSSGSSGDASGRGYGRSYGHGGSHGVGQSSAVAAVAKISRMVSSISPADNGHGYNMGYDSGRSSGSSGFSNGSQNNDFAPHSSSKFFKNLSTSSDNKSKGRVPNPYLADYHQSPRSFASASAAALSNSIGHNGSSSKNGSSVFDSRLSGANKHQSHFNPHASKYGDHDENASPRSYGHNNNNYGSHASAIVDSARGNGNGIEANYDDDDATSDVLANWRAKNAATTRAAAAAAVAAGNGNDGEPVSVTRILAAADAGLGVSSPSNLSSQSSDGGRRYNHVGSPGPLSGRSSGSSDGLGGGLGVSPRSGSSDSGVVCAADPLSDREHYYGGFGRDRDRGHARYDNQEQVELLSPRSGVISPLSGVMDF